MDLHIQSGSTYPLWIRISTLDPRIHCESAYPLWIHVTTVDPHIHSMDPRIHYGSAYPLWICASTMDPRIHYGSAYPLWIRISTMDPHIQSWSAHPLWIHVSTLDPRSGIHTFTTRCASPYVIFSLDRRTAYMSFSSPSLVSLCRGFSIAYGPGGHSRKGVGSWKWGRGRKG